MFFDERLPVLPHDGCLALLASWNIGRISLTVGALPAVVPVTYQCLGGDVIIGLNDGPALRRLAGETIIALEVDNATSSAVTWAVLVIGRAIEVTNPDERTEFRALEVASSSNGIAHSHYVRLRPDHISGYHSTTS
jgi:uncharacterized protein